MEQKKILIHTRIDAEVDAGLTAIAKRLDVSRASLIKLIFDDFLARDEKSPYSLGFFNSKNKEQQ